MDYYQIKWTNSAKKELKKLDKKVIPRLIDAIDELAKNPYPQGVKKIVNSENNYRIRVGDYRIIYQVISNTLIIYIVKVRQYVIQNQDDKDAFCEYLDRLKANSDDKIYSHSLSANEIETVISNYIKRNRNDSSTNRNFN